MMVYLPASDSGANLDALRALKGLQSGIEEYRRAMKVMAKLQTEEVLRTRRAIEGLSEQVYPVIGQVQEMTKMAQTLQNQSFPAIRAAQELAQQRKQIQTALSEVQSAFKAVTAISSQQWALLAIASGVSVSATPLWTSVPAVAPPVSDLPAVTVTQVATVLAGEAGHAASALFTTAAHFAESIFTDYSKRVIAMFIAAAVIAVATNENPSLKDVRGAFWWQPLLFALIKWTFFGEDD